MIDDRLEAKQLGKEIIATLGQENVATENKVKCIIEELDIPGSVQWMTKKYDPEDKKLSNNDWRTEQHILVFVPASKILEILKNSNIDAENLLSQCLGMTPDPKSDRIRIILTSEKRTANNKADDKVLEAEMKRLTQEKAFNLATECLVEFNTDLILDIHDTKAAIDKVVKSTKSILELIQHRATLPTADVNNADDEDDLGAWYPRKSGPPVSVNKNKVGLTNLWQRYLMQVSKGVNVEQAKVITADTGFATIEATIRSYAGCHNDERMAVDLLIGKTLRPSGATKDSLSLGNKRPSVGQETSRKIYKVLTSIDADLKI